MKAVIVSDFIGIINDVVIEEKRIYYSIEYILSKIEKKFGQCYNKRFINFKLRVHRTKRCIEFSLCLRRKFLVAQGRGCRCLDTYLRQPLSVKCKCR